MIKRLMNASGELYPVGSDWCPPVECGPLVGVVADPNQLVKPAILVHSGPDGSDLVFESSEGPIVFNKSRILKIVEKQNKRIKELEAQYGGREKTPIGAYKSLLDQHGDDSNDRVRGKLNHYLWFEYRDVPKVGKNVACAMTLVTIIGQENIQRVLDGRIYHLSIAIDDETDTLGETSTVIEPAAAGAMLLSKSKKGDTKMPLKHLAEASAKRLANLALMKTGISELSAKLVTTKETVALTKRHGEITHRLSGLVAAKKLTPAEYKKLDIKRLAKLDDESLKTSLAMFDIREDVIEAGQRGSTESVTFAELGENLEKKQLKRLTSEALKDMAKFSGKKIKLKSGAKLEDDEDSADLEDDSHKEEKELAAVEETDAVKAKMAAHADMGKCLESGDLDGAKKCYAKMAKSSGGMKHLSMGYGSDDGLDEGAIKDMALMQSQIDEVTTQLARLAGMVEEIMTAEKEAQQAEMTQASEGKPDELNGDKPAAEGDKPAAEGDKKAETLDPAPAQDQEKDKAKAAEIESEAGKV